MTMRAKTTTGPALRTAAGQPVDRAWFLLDAAWHDPVWTFKPTNVLEEPRPVRIRWAFSLPSGGRFTDARHAALLETSRQLVAMVRSRSLSSGLAQRASTAAGYFMYLRELLRWMDGAGIVRFGDLDARAVLQFQHHLAQRPGLSRT